jgi:KipI family sensor histidine kinase inhibitor
LETKPPRYLPFGDAALIVEFGDRIDLEINRKVLALDQALARKEIRGVEECVPTYRSLLIRYNPLKISYEELVFQIRDLENSIPQTIFKEERVKKKVIPVVYGGKYGPDLKNVAETHGLTEEEVIRIHSAKPYRVYMIGFVAGFPYLGVVDDAIATPRQKTPRIRVPAGSVGIAGKQTGIYPCEAPGGWQIIGRTPLKLFDPFKQPPTLLKPGDTVKFKPITEREFEKLKAEK